MADAVTSTSRAFSRRGSADSAAPSPIVVLKLGGSILERPGHIARAVHECYRWVRSGHRVVAVVSAIGDTTDRLTSDAAAYGHDPSPHAYAALVAQGESTSAAHLWLGLDRAGIAAIALDPRAAGVRVTGDPTDARPIAFRAERVRRELARVSVVVVPGFVGIDESDRWALLGRGGSDLSAIVIAEALSARCRLLKDVPGLYEHDPGRPGPLARRYASVTFADAARLDGTILQPKALAYAASRGFPFEVAGLGRVDATIVGAKQTLRVEESHGPRLRVAILGFGVVGRGVWTHLAADRERFEVKGVAVRHPKRHADLLPPSVLRRDLSALAGDPSIDLVVECLGGLEPAGTCIATALARGADVVSANKSLLALRGAEFLNLASQRGGTLRASAAVGGAAPCLETIARLAGEREIDSIEGVLNGTTNAMLDRLEEGWTFDDALAEAQARGFAESDPSADVDGFDAAEKVQLLARAAFGSASRAAMIAPERISGIRDRTGTSGPGRRTRLVARATRRGCSVGPEELPIEHPLASVRGVWNRLIVRTSAGEAIIVDGKGAGRWPTAEALMADALDCWRARAATPAWPDRTAEPCDAGACAIGGAA